MQQIAQNNTGAVDLWGRSQQAVENQRLTPFVSGIPNVQHLASLAAQHQSGGASLFAQAAMSGQYGTPVLPQMPVSTRAAWTPVVCGTPTPRSSPTRRDCSTPFRIHRHSRPSTSRSESSVHIRPEASKASSDLAGHPGTFQLRTTSYPVRSRTLTPTSPTTVPPHRVRASLPHCLRTVHRIRSREQHSDRAVPAASRSRQPSATQRPSKPSWLARAPSTSTARMCSGCRMEPWLR